MAVNPFINTSSTSIGDDLRQIKNEGFSQRQTGLTGGLGRSVIGQSVGLPTQGLPSESKPTANVSGGSTSTTATGNVKSVGGSGDGGSRGGGKASTSTSTAGGTLSGDVLSGIGTVVGVVGGPLGQVASLGFSAAAASQDIADEGLAGGIVDPVSATTNRHTLGLAGKSAKEQVQDRVTKANRQRAGTFDAGAASKKADATRRSTFDLGNKRDDKGRGRSGRAADQKSGRTGLR